MKKPAVDCVSPKLCPTLPCYWAGEDKGSYVQGRGYTSYHRTPRLCCMTRHLRGCPTTSICDDPECRSAMGPADPPDKCRRCGGPVTATPEEDK